MGGEESGNGGFNKQWKAAHSLHNEFTARKKEIALNLYCASWLTNTPQSLKQTKLCLWVQIPDELLDELSTLLRDKVVGKGPLKLHLV